MPETKSEKILKDISDKTFEHEFYNNLPSGYKKGKTKYIVVTGSVISGIGKGTFTACLGNILKLHHGFKVAPIKFDGYLNYDAGTLNPFRHGEVFVLNDGTECDLDLGSYERMISTNLTKSNYLTAGKIFKDLIDKERAGKYLGRDVQFIPHVTGEIKSFVRNLAVESDADVVLIEVGGTVGDLENGYFIEAMRELAYEDGKENVCFVNVVYILEPGYMGEQKSKAAQLGLKSLMSMGIQPNIIVCRSENPITTTIKEKISVYSNVPVDQIVNAMDANNIYKIPIVLKDMGVDETVIRLLNLKKKNNGSDFAKWQKFADKMTEKNKEVTIGITGKYTNVHDSYISIIKALEHSAPYVGAKVKMKWIETTDVTKDNVASKLDNVDGIIVPGGFGTRGAEGKIECIRYARENKLPYFGLCYGFQMALVEYARNVCKLEGANSTEIDDKAKYPVIDILPEQKEIQNLGGTMRLGGHDVVIKKGTRTHKLLGSDTVVRRFRHRFECNPEYIETFEKNGIVFSGRAKDKRIMQILELPGHPFFFGVQFHPEFTSRPLDPDPMYVEFIKVAMEKSA
ncbi:MAG: CTP synthase (glutamine hydrolyzing) [Candidatus Aenigmatarchaeota archaeon]